MFGAGVQLARLETVRMAIGSVEDECVRRCYSYILCMICSYFLVQMGAFV